MGFFRSAIVRDMVNTGHPILIIALPLILGNTSHAILKRDTPVMNFAQVGWPFLV